MDDLLPPCPDRFQCPITQFRMVDPVIAKDGHSYDRKAIQQWFDAGHNTSPKQNNVISTELTPNHGLKTQIQEWVEENTGLNGLEKQLKAPQGSLAMASTPKEALDAIEVISELVTRSQLSGFCVLGPKGVGKMRGIVEFAGNLSDDVTSALSTLEQQCIANVFELQKKYATILQKRSTLQKAKEKMMGGGDKKLKKDAAAAEKRQAAAQTMFDAAKRELETATEINTKLQESLERFTNQTSLFKKLENEINQEEEKMVQQLVCVEEELVVDEVDSSSGSSSSSTSSSSSSTKSGSKRGRSSSSSSSSSSRKSKRQKKKILVEEEEREDEDEEKHPGRWLYEEGIAYLYGSDFKKKDVERGRMMIEASASSGFPMAVAFCHYWGWNGLKRDFKEAFEMFLKIEKETNGDHWAQFRLGSCYQYGHSTDQDHNKGFEFFTISAEQGNSVAMNNLGYCHENGFGVRKDLNKAKEWYTKAAAQGHVLAQDALDDIIVAHQEEENNDDDEL